LMSGRLDVTARRVQILLACCRMVVLA
jgi:hypothetical protein